MNAIIRYLRGQLGDSCAGNSTNYLAHAVILWAVLATATNRASARITVPFILTAAADTFILADRIRVRYRGCRSVAERDECESQDSYPEPCVPTNKHTCSSHRSKTTKYIRSVGGVHYGCARIAPPSAGLKDRNIHVDTWATAWFGVLLVALRSIPSGVFFIPRGDLAFDGENGVIRVLPGRKPTKLTHQTALRRGMDIFFDELPVNFGLAQDSVTIESAPKSCETPKGLSLDTSR